MGFRWAITTPARRAQRPTPRSPRRSGLLGERKRGMGRGLAAILPESGAGGPELRELPVELIGPNPDQPRSGFEKGALDALTDSIKAAGVLQPVVVRPVDGGRYELIAGERRWRWGGRAGGPPRPPRGG